MKAILFDSDRRPNYAEIVNPDLESSNGVRVSVKSVGLCGSDIHRINSDSDLEGKVLGHEISGLVTDLGIGVDKDLYHKRVVVVPFIPCNVCERCLDEDYALCTDLVGFGRGINGGFADEVVVPKTNVHAFSDNLSFDAAALTDVYAVALHAYNLSDRPRNKDVLIYGNGPIGIACLQLFSIYDNKVSVIGRNNGQYVLRNNGAFITSKDVKQLGSNSFDVVIEAVGGSQQVTINDSITLVKPKGRIVVEGVFGEGYLGKINYRELFYKEAIIQGANSYSIATGNNEFMQALQLLEEGIVDPTKMISHTLPLSKFGEGLELFQNKGRYGAMKIIFNP